jgi:predicted nucleic acid-binding protein
VYLLDTNVVSELRRARPQGAVVAWVKSIPDEHLHGSAVTLGELQAGVEITRDRDPDNAAEIEAWIGRIAGLYNVPPLDGSCFRVWARLMHGRPDDLIMDALIAATASVHNLMVVTRNVRDFRRLGSPTLNPWSLRLDLGQDWAGQPPPISARGSQSAISGNIMTMSMAVICISMNGQSA